jgi:signal transduction histidine kinase
VHPLLARQLKRCFQGELGDDPRLAAFARAVGEAYQSADEERALLENSLELSSRELEERYANLRADLARREQLQRELAQAQKLEAVGQLASGVAHEINTPMQFIGDNVQFSLDAFADLARWVAGALGALEQAELPAPRRTALEDLARETELRYQLEELPRALGEARDGVKRVAELVKALKEFAHADQPEMDEADINQALERTLVLTRGVLKHVARVEVDLQPLPPVRCHVGLLNQAFLNLLVNAGHAIEDRERKAARPGVGTISVATRHLEGTVEVRITDTGCGIPEAIRDRIFEPFFTTKEVGRGSGQGLPLVRSVVVDRHGGQVSFESRLDVGTTFIVSLPLDPTAARRTAA